MAGVLSGIMNNTNCRMTTLTVWEGADTEYLNVAATLIRVMPEVLRVRVDFEARKLEVLSQSYCPGLLQKMHRALLLAGIELLALKTD
jgi:hypothetical protein